MKCIHKSLKTIMLTYDFQQLLTMSENIIFISFKKMNLFYVELKKNQVFITV